MAFEAILDQAIACSSVAERLTYRALQRQFHFDDAALTALKDELLYATASVSTMWGAAWSGPVPRAHPPTSLHRLRHLCQRRVHKA